MSGEEDGGALGGPEVHPATVRAASAAKIPVPKAWLVMSAVTIT